jgi:hypothetical protein
MVFYADYGKRRMIYLRQQLAQVGKQRLLDHHTNKRHVEYLINISCRVIYEGMDITPEEFGL